MQKIIVFLFVSFGILLNTVSAQCGPDGTQPCPKKTPVPLSKDSKEAAAKQRAERERAEHERIERLRAQRERLKRKQLEEQKAKTTAQMIDNVIKYRDSLKNQKPIELFPVENVTLGKTGSKMLSLTAEKCSDESNCYQINGIYFYCNEKGLTETLYLSRLRFGGMPENWKNAGFNWDLSYNEWMDLFKKMGYVPFVTQKPVTEASSGQKFLKAEFLTWVTTPDGKAQIVLKFNYGFGKTLVTDKGTLFAIEINRTS